jgi:hypothetical protein
MTTAQSKIYSYVSDFIVDRLSDDLKETGSKNNLYVRDFLGDQVHFLLTMQHDDCIFDISDAPEIVDKIVDCMYPNLSVSLPLDKQHEIEWFVTFKNCREPLIRLFASYGAAFVKNAATNEDIENNEALDTVIDELCNINIVSSVDSDDESDGDA